MNNLAFWNPGDQILIWAVNVLLQVTLATLISLVIAAAMRRSPAVRYWILCSSLLLVLFSPAIALVMQLSGSGLLSVSLMHEVMDSVIEAKPSPLQMDSKRGDALSLSRPNDDMVNASSFARNSTAILFEPRVFDSLEPNETRVTLPEASIAKTSLPTGEMEAVQAKINVTIASRPTTNWIGRIVRVAMPPMLFVWLIGTIFFVARLTIGCIRLARILGSARPIANGMLNESFKQVGQRLKLARLPKLVVSSKVSGPVAAGLFRPRVVLPERMVGRITPEQLRDILVHEVAHIVRRDQLIALLQNIAAAIYWPHPFVKSLNRQLAQAREEVCDNYVLAATDAPAYSRTLLTLAELVQSAGPLPGAVGLFTSRWKLERRVAGLLDERRNRMIRLTASGKTFVISLSVVMTTIAALGTMTLAIGQSGKNDSTVVADKTVNDVAADRAQNSDTSRTIATKTDSDSGGRTIKIRGVVIGDDGKPAAGALIAAVGLASVRKVGATHQVLGESVADREGRYELSLRGDLSTKDYIPTLFARTKQSGIAWHSIDLNVDKATLDVNLKPQQLIQLRLVDIEGRPAANLNVKLTSISVANGSFGQGVGLPELDPMPEAVRFSLKSDENGLLSIPNISPDHGVYLSVVGTDHFAPQDLALNSGMSEERSDRDATYRPLAKNMKPGDVATIPIAPAQIFEGVVLFGDSGKSVANTRISMWASQQDVGGSMYAINGRTDANGRFRLNPMPGVRFGITAYPPEGSPYQIRELNDLRWSTGAASKNIEIRLDRGILAHGTIVDSKTGKPLRKASVQYYPDQVNNKFITPDAVTGWQSIQPTNESGEFAITVLPGPGTLVVHANEGSYVLQELGSREVDEGKPGGARMYAQAFHKINPAVNEAMEAIKIELKSGAVIKGTITDKAGKPVEHAIFFSRFQIHPTSPQWRSFPEEAIHGKFEINGLKDGEEYPVYFLDPKNRLGATAMISAKNPTPTIVLEPCGAATVRFVGTDGNPVVGEMFGLHIVVTPGKAKYDLQAMEHGELVADEDFTSNVDRLNYGSSNITNEMGEMFFPVLIPGARYRFINMANGKASVAKEFVAKSGETYDMGEIKVDIGR